MFYLGFIIENYHIVETIHGKYWK